MSEAKLTREQKEFLKECEMEFADRFTDSDEEYKKAYDRGIRTPPIVSPWFGRPRFTNAWVKNRHDRNDRDRYGDRESRYDRRDGRDHGYAHTNVRTTDEHSYKL